MPGADGVISAFGAACNECRGCRNPLPPQRMAFQPIVDVSRGGAIFAYEALVRGAAGEGAGAVLARVGPRDLYTFDQACRVAAIEEASRLGLAGTGALLSINILPNAVYDPETCLYLPLLTARRTGLPTSALVFEISETEKVRDPGQVHRIFDAYREMGIKVAIDDFGAGHAGLGLLAEMRVDMVKLDRGLVRGIDADRTRRAILRGVLLTCAELDVQVVAEGVETEAELATLRELGVALFQGYLIARPALGVLPVPEFARLAPALA